MSLSVYAYKANFLFPLLFPVPVEVVPAVNLPVPEKALVVQEPPAQLALDALRVPGLVHEVQQEAVQDRALAPGAVHGHHLDADGDGRPAQGAALLGMAQKCIKNGGGDKCPSLLN